MSLPRLQSLHRRTLAADLLALTFRHVPSGAPIAAARAPPSASRTRPYLPTPPSLAPGTIPAISKIVLHSTHRDMVADKNMLLPALTALHTISGVRPEVVFAKKDAAAWKLRRGAPIAAKATLTGHRMYEFLDHLVHVVLPRSKDFDALSPRIGDGHKSITMGFGPQVLALWPEMETVWERMVRVFGLHVTIVASGSVRDMGEVRLLLTGLGLPVRGRVARPREVLERMLADAGAGEADEDGAGEGDEGVAASEE